MRRNATALVMMLLVAACRAGGRDDADHAHGAEGRVAAITHFGDSTELFVEFEPLVAGKETRMAAHLTRLADWRPLGEGRVTVTLADGERKETFEVQGPATPGIFRPSPRPATAGKRRLTLTVNAPGVAEVHDLGDVVVHASPDAAAKGSTPEARGSGQIAFPLEQQWRIDFGTTAGAERVLHPSVVANGVLRARSDGEAHVVAPVTGRLVGAGASFPHVGMTVKRDEVLAAIAPRLGAEADPATLEAAAGQARTKLEFARKERERLEALYAEQAVPERRVAEARAAETVAREEDAAASRRLSQYRGTQRATGEGATGKVELRSPVAGVVAAVSTAPGAFVEEGKALFHVVDPGRLWLDVQVPEADIGRIGKPAGAWFEVQGFEKPFTVDPRAGGKVVAFGGVVDSQTRTTPLLFEVLNPGGALRVGMFARVHVLAGEPVKGLAIPVSAVVDDGKQEVVFVLSSAEAFERRPVKLGVRDGDWVQVLDGLAPGERVVSRGAWQVRLAAAGGAVPSSGHVH
jgi:membrane fusion protein, heavy metal efflux system